MIVRSLRWLISNKRLTGFGRRFLGAADLKKESGLETVYSMLTLTSVVAMDEATGEADQGTQNIRRPLLQILTIPVLY
jgi:hypothetical protein